MARVHAEASATIDASPEAIYKIISDYKEGHPRILPEKNFSDLRVEEGGVGAGTVISFTTKAAGTETKYRMKVEEPEPGRVLVERDLVGDVVTTFTVTPVEGGKSLVKIATDYTASGGLKGFVERLASPGVLRKIYEAELKQLAEVVTGG